MTRPVALIEQALGRKAVVELTGMQPGDVEATAADITESARDLGFAPSTPLDVGIPRFIDWFAGHYPA